MIWTKVGSFMMFLAVALGAFGAHALRQKLDAHALDIYKTAVLYHFFHALGIFAVAWLSTITQDPKVNLAGIFLTTGIVLFSGSLYLMALTGWKWLGPVTPLGGLSFLVAWGMVFLVQYSR